MRIFVTGGIGLLGSKLAKIALEEGHDVFSGYCHNNPYIGKGIKFDLTNENSIKKAIKEIKPELIIHNCLLQIMISV